MRVFQNPDLIMRYMMAKQMSLIKNIDIGYFALKRKESLVITREFENIFNLVLFHTSVIIVIV